MKTLLLIFIQKTLEIMMNDRNALSTDCSRETELEMKELFNCLFHTHIDDTHFQVKCCISGHVSGTVTTIFQKTTEIMTKFELPWKNCVTCHVIHNRGHKEPVRLIHCE